MYKVCLAKTEFIDLISELESDNFFGEAYSKDTISEMMKDNYIPKNNDNIMIIENDGDLIGYIIYHIQNDFTDIYKIFVRESDRKNGCGKMLVNEVYNLSKRFNSKKIMIEVRSKNNNAISFYNSCGFKNISKRENYYVNPNDDAIIFEKVIK